MAGGGPGGCAVALGLRRHAPHLSVALIESSRYEGERVGETLPPHVRPVLEQIGVHEAFARSGAREVHGTAAAWGDRALRPNDFVFGARGPGWHVDRSAFDMLLSSEAEDAGAVVSRGTLVGSVDGDAGRWTVDTSAGTMTARFVVDATGHAASIARKRGARVVDVDRLVAYARFVDDRTSRDARTLVEAFADGWWYTAGLPGGRRIVACVTDADLGRRLDLGDAAGWGAELARTEHVAGSISSRGADGPVIVRPTHSRRLDRAAGPGWIAVGDAASSFDPLSSQGILKALRSGTFATYAIADTLGGDPGSLDRYRRFVASEFDAYLRARAGFYALERRWTQGDFWRRRQRVRSPGRRLEGAT